MLAQVLAAVAINIVYSLEWGRKSHYLPIESSVGPWFLEAENLPISSAAQTITHEYSYISIYNSNKI